MSMEHKRMHRKNDNNRHDNGDRNVYDKNDNVNGYGTTKTTTWL